MSALYEESHRRLQRQFDTQRLADRIEERLFRTALDGRRSRVHRAARPVLPRDRQLARRAELLLQRRRSRLRPRARRAHARVPVLRRQRHVSVDGQRGRERPRRHAVHRPLLAEAAARERHGAHRAARVRRRRVFPKRSSSSSSSIREVFPNCPRYIHKYALVERSKFVPHEGTVTPIPGWKQMDWARDVLPHNDPARSEA